MTLPTLSGLRSAARALAHVAVHVALIAAGAWLAASLAERWGR